MNQTGTGTTILIATNTYTGGTTIGAGTLQVGNGGTAGSITHYLTFGLQEGRTGFLTDDWG